MIDKDSLLKSCDEQLTKMFQDPSVPTMDRGQIGFTFIVENGKVATITREKHVETVTKGR